jgi:hypothetical protein
VTVLPLGAGLPKPYGFDVHPYLREIMNRVGLGAHPVREISIYKGRSVGPTSGILENCIGYYRATVDAQLQPVLLDEHAFAGGDAEVEPQWAPNNSNPVDDLNAFVNWLRSPGYQAALNAERRAYVAELEQRRAHLSELSSLIRNPGPRPDLVIIDGVGYGKDDPLPPPFGRHDTGGQGS